MSRAYWPTWRADRSTHATPVFLASIVAVDPSMFRLNSRGFRWTSVLIRTAVFDNPPRAVRVLRALAVTACLPYLALKIAWASGSRVGIPGGSALLANHTTMIVGSIDSALLDSNAARFLVGILVVTMGARFFADRDAQFRHGEESVTSLDSELHPEPTPGWDYEAVRAGLPELARSAFPIGSGGD